jgi:hypothetical protein
LSSRVSEAGTTALINHALSCWPPSLGLWARRSWGAVFAKPARPENTPIRGKDPLFAPGPFLPGSEGHPGDTGSPPENSHLGKARIAQRSVPIRGVSEKDKKFCEMASNELTLKTPQI